MEQLPNEVLHSIGTYLENNFNSKDLLSLVLCNQRLHKFYLPFMLRSIQVHFFSPRHIRLIMLV